MRLCSYPSSEVRHLVLVVAAAIYFVGINFRENRAADPPRADGRDAEVEIRSPGVRLTRFADDPGLVTPTGVDVDQSGNVWVVATHTHFRPDDYDGPRHRAVSKVCVTSRPRLPTRYQTPPLRRRGSL